MWRVLTDQNLSPLASLVTLSFKTATDYWKQPTNGHTYHCNGKY